jgi:hypothetical protein
VSTFTDPAVWETILADERRAIALRQNARVAIAPVDEPVAGAEQVLGAPAPGPLLIARDIWREYGGSLVRAALILIGAALLTAAVLVHTAAWSITCGAYLTLVAVLGWRWSHRERQDTDEHFGRVREQLFRIKSTLDVVEPDTDWE